MDHKNVIKIMTISGGDNNASIEQKTALGADIN